MGDFLNKIIGTIIAFLIIFVGPATMLTLSAQLEMERGVFNEMTGLIDKVTDTGKLTDEQYADFLLGISSYGAVMDVELIRYLTMVVPDGSGGTTTVYQIVDNTSDYNKGDYFQVRVRAIDYTGAQRLIFRIANVFTGKFDETLAGRVRN